MCHDLIVTIFHKIMLAAWWHGCVVSNWFILLEHMPKNAEPDTVARISVSDGTSAWEETFNVDKIDMIGNKRCGEKNVLERIKYTAHSKLSEALQISAHSNVDVNMQFTDISGSYIFELKHKITCDDFISRSILYDAHLHASMTDSNKRSSEIEVERSVLERNVEVTVKKIKQFEDKLVHGVRVLMQQKMEHSW